ncbi:VOC family protein [Chitinimonas sp. BJYL2]|uniref:VOC family protein n=1 Tax=Chitinimonas sp. BJYL2 TaxID=2976696 RepID=UPI0022B2F37D|nr:VOC family protein [Chitinimonas sp. BJYL2]
MAGQNAINWFEIPVEDFDRAKRFYSAIFAYEMPEWPMEGLRMGVLPHTDAGVGGTIIHVPGFYKPSQDGVLIYLNGGDDLSVVLDRVEPAGGKVQIAKRLITEEIGYMGVFTDSEGNRIALHSPH